MAGYRDRRSAIFVIVGLLLVWELIYWLRLIDPARFSHPIAILKTFGDLDLLGWFTVFLVQMAVASLLGGPLGIILGILIIRSTWLTQATLRFLRIGHWLPVFIYWPLPIWPPRDGYEVVSIFWAWTASVAALALFNCYHYLAARFSPGREWTQDRIRLTRASILHALFVSLISQIWLGGYGWGWFRFPRVEIALGYASLIFLLALLFLFEIIFRRNFDVTADDRGVVLVKELVNRSWRSLLGAVLLTLLCLLLWHLLLPVLPGYLLISSPLEVAKGFYLTLIKGTNISPMDETIWSHLSVSLIEVLGGLILSGGAALLVLKGSSIYPTFRSRALQLLPLTYVVPIILPFFLNHWIGLAGIWQTVMAVACLSFFPFVQVLWGLRERTLLCRIFMAVDEALPFAFVAMLFGEGISALAGLGFFALVARDTGHVAEGLTASLITLVLLVGLSSTLRAVVKWRYFPARA